MDRSARARCWWLVVAVLAAAACGPTSPPATRANGQGRFTPPAPAPSPPAVPADITVDRFEFDWNIADGELELRIDTDLPDFASMFVSVSRRYLQTGRADAYSRDYLAEKCTVRDWRTARRVSLDPERWKADLKQFQAKMARVGRDVAFDVACIDPDIEIRAVVHLNQPDPRFGGPTNPRLRGAAVGVENSGTASEQRFITKEITVPYPLEGPRLRESTDATSWDALEVGRTYRCSKGVPLMPSFESDDSLSDISRMQRVPSTGTLGVLEVREKRGTRWYRVNAQWGGSEATGWISSVALLGQGVDAVSPRHARAAVPARREPEEPKPAVTPRPKPVFVVTIKGGRRIKAVEAKEVGEEVHVRTCDGVGIKYPRSWVLKIENTED